MSDAKGSSSTTSSKTTLTADQTAVLQLVTVVPEPRTRDELAKRYDGLRFENQWPQQSQKSVKERIDDLIDKGKLKEGDDAPDGEPTIELVSD